MQCNSMPSSRWKWWCHYTSTFNWNTTHTIFCIFLLYFTSAAAVCKSSGPVTFLKQLATLHSKEKLKRALSLKIFLGFLSPSHQQYHKTCNLPKMLSLSLDFKDTMPFYSRGVARLKVRFYWGEPSVKTLGCLLQGVVLSDLWICALPQHHYHYRHHYCCS